MSLFRALIMKLADSAKKFLAFGSAYSDQEVNNFNTVGRLKYVKGMMGFSRDAYFEFSPLSKSTNDADYVVKINLECNSTTLQTLLHAYKFIRLYIQDGWIRMQDEVNDVVYNIRAVQLYDTITIKVNVNGSMVTVYTKIDGTDSDLVKSREFEYTGITTTEKGPFLFGRYKNPNSYDNYFPYLGWVEMDDSYFEVGGIKRTFREMVIEDQAWTSTAHGELNYEDPSQLTTMELRNLSTSGSPTKVGGECYNFNNSNYYYGTNFRPGTGVSWDLFVTTKLNTIPTDGSSTVCSVNYNTNYNRCIDIGFTTVGKIWVGLGSTSNDWWDILSKSTADPVQVGVKYNVHINFNGSRYLVEYKRAEDSEYTNIATVETTTSIRTPQNIYFGYNPDTRYPGTGLSIFPAECSVTVNGSTATYGEWLYGDGGYTGWSATNLSVVKSPITTETHNFSLTIPCTVTGFFKSYYSGTRYGHLFRNPTRQDYSILIDFYRNHSTTYLRYYVYSSLTGTIIFNGTYTWNIYDKKVLIQLNYDDQTGYVLRFSQDNGSTWTNVTTNANTTRPVTKDNLLFFVGGNCFGSQAAWPGKIYLDELSWVVDGEENINHETLKQDSGKTLYVNDQLLSEITSDYALTGFINQKCYAQAILRKPTTSLDLIVKVHTPRDNYNSWYDSGNRTATTQYMSFLESTDSANPYKSLVYRWYMENGTTSVRIWMSSNGNDWNIASGWNPGITGIPFNKDVWFRLTWDGTTYRAGYSLDGETYTYGSSLSSTAAVRCDHNKINLGGCYWEDYAWTHTGLIYPNESHFYVDGGEIWTGITPAIAIGDTVYVNEGMATSEYQWTAYRTKDGPFGEFTKSTVVRDILRDEHGDIVYEVNEVENEVNEVEFNAGIQYYCLSNEDDTKDYYSITPLHYEYPETVYYSYPNLVHGEGYMFYTGTGIRIEQTADWANWKTWCFESDFISAGNRGDNDNVLFGCATYETWPLLFIKSDGKLALRLNGTSYTSSVNVPTISTVKCKAYFTGTEYRVDISSDGGETWTNYITVSLSTRSSDTGNVYLFGYPGSTGAYFRGLAKTAKFTYTTDDSDEEQVFFDLSTATKSQVQNFNLEGSPTESSSLVYTGFTENDYIYVSRVPEAITTYELCIKFKVNSITAGCILGNLNTNKHSPQIEITADGHVKYLHCDGTYEWQTKTADTVLEVDKWYWLKTIYDANEDNGSGGAGVYRIYLSEDGVNFVRKGTNKSSTGCGWDDGFELGADRHATPFDGSIDLTATYIKINGKNWFIPQGNVQGDYTLMSAYESNDMTYTGFTNQQVFLIQLGNYSYTTFDFYYDCIHQQYNSSSYRNLLYPFMTYNYRDWMYIYRGTTSSRTTVTYGTKYRYHYHVDRSTMKMSAYIVNTDTQAETLIYTISLDDSSSSSYMPKLASISQIYIGYWGTSTSYNYNPTVIVDMSNTVIKIDGEQIPFGMYRFSNTIYDDNLQPTQLSLTYKQDIERFIIDWDAYHWNYDKSPRTEPVEFNLLTYGNDIDEEGTNVSAAVETSVNDAKIDTATDKTYNVSIYRSQSGSEYRDYLVSYSRELLPGYKNYLEINGRLVTAADMPVIYKANTPVVYTATDALGNVRYSKVNYYTINKDIKLKTFRVTPDQGDAKITYYVNNFQIPPTETTLSVYKGDVITYTVEKEHFVTYTGSYTMVNADTDVTVNVTLTPLYSVTINATPADATITQSVNFVKQAEGYGEYLTGTVVDWTVEKLGYHPKSGTVTLGTTNQVINVDLEEATTVQAITYPLNARNNGEYRMDDDGVLTFPMDNNALRTTEDIILSGKESWEIKIVFRLTWPYMNTDTRALFGSDSSVYNNPTLYFNTNRNVCWSIPRKQDQYWKQEEVGVQLGRNHIYDFRIGKTAEWLYYVDYRMKTWDSSTNTYSDWSAVTRLKSFTPGTINKDLRSLGQMRFGGGAGYNHPAFSMYVKESGITINGESFHPLYKLFDVGDTCWVNHGVGSSEYEYTATHYHTSQVNQYSEKGAVTAAETLQDGRQLVTVDLSSNYVYPTTITVDQTANLVTYGELPTVDATIETPVDNAVILPNKDEKNDPLPVFKNVYHLHIDQMDPEIFTTYLEIGGVECDPSLGSYRMTNRTPYTIRVLTKAGLLVFSKSGLINGSDVWVRYSGVSPYCMMYDVPGGIGTLRLIVYGVEWETYDYYADLVERYEEYYQETGEEYYHEQAEYYRPYIGTELDAKTPIPVYPGQVVNYEWVADGGITYHGRYVGPSVPHTTGTQHAWQSSSMEPEVTLTVTSDVGTTIGMDLYRHNQVNNTLTAAPGKLAVEGGDLQSQNYLNYGCTITEV